MEEGATADTTPYPHSRSDQLYLVRGPVTSQVFMAAYTNKTEFQASKAATGTVIGKSISDKRRCYHICMATSRLECHGAGTLGT